MAMPPLVQDVNINPQFMVEGGVEAPAHIALGGATEANIGGGAGMVHAAGDAVADRAQQGGIAKLTEIVEYPQVVLPSQGIRKHIPKLTRMANVIVRVRDFIKLHSGGNINSDHLTHLTDFN